MKHHLILGALLSVLSFSTFAQIIDQQNIEFSFQKLKRVRFLYGAAVIEGTGKYNVSNSIFVPGQWTGVMPLEVRIIGKTLNDQEERGHRAMFTEFLSLSLTNPGQNILHCSVYTQAGWDNKLVQSLYGNVSQIETTSSGKAVITIANGGFSTPEFCELGPNKLQYLKPNQEDTSGASEAE